MKTTPIQFDSSIYRDTVSGMNYKKYCNKSYKPSAYDLSCDTVVEDGDVWFVKRDFLPEFFSALPENSPSINVVTQHSDFEVDDFIMNSKPKAVKRIYGSNTTSQSESAVPIPLGLGPPYCPVTPKAEDIAKLDTLKHRSRLLYVNFRPQTYPLERMIVLEQMVFLSNKCSEVTIAKQDSDSTVICGYLNELIEHKFCVCPRGNGIDTHRLWEALYSRTIPIVRYEQAYRNFIDLPILFVDDWEQVTEDCLYNEYEKMLNCEWDYSKLKASWWGKKVKEYS